MASKKTEPKKEGVVVHSLALAPDTEKILERLSGEASDYIGRKVSESAIIRALVRFADRQDYQWVLAQLCPLVEEELASGITWGRKDRRGERG